MGGHSYTPSTFKATKAAKAAAGIPLFTHSAAVASGTAVGVHSSLDPKRLNKSGENIRESRDSDVHPDSVAVWVNFDGTGSMVDYPERLSKKLADLMATLVKDGWLKHPHILFSQSQDFQDDYPIQLGQFEGGNQMDEALTNMVIRAGGAGQLTNHEAYTLPLFYAARQTRIDCYEKRGKKGYMFILGDELIWPEISPQQVMDNFGITIDKAISREQLIAEVREKYNLHWIIPEGTFHYNDKSVTDKLQLWFGENFHRLEDGNAVCEFIAGIIALQEGFELEDIKSNLVNIGGCPMAAGAAGSALTTYAAKANITVIGKGASSEALAEAEAGGKASRL